MNMPKQSRFENVWIKKYGVTKRVVKTISLPICLLVRVEELAVEENLATSEVIAWLIDLGLTYLKLIEEQKKIREEQEEEGKKKIKK